MGLTALLHGSAQEKVTGAARPDVLRGSPPEAHLPPQSQGPVLPYLQGRDVLTRVSKGTTIAHIVYVGSHPLEAPRPSLMAEFEYLTRQFDAAVVVNVTSVKGELTPEHDWVFSEVEGEIVDHIKGALDGRRSDAGIPIVSFRASGGTAQAGGVRVVATGPFEQVVAGRQYIAFLFVEQDGTYRAAPAQLFEVVDDKVRALQREPGSSEFLDGRLGFHVATMRAASSLGRVWAAGGIR